MPKTTMSVSGPRRNGAPRRMPRTQQWPPRVLAFLIGVSALSVGPVADASPNSAPFLVAAADLPHFRDDLAGYRLADALERQLAAGAHGSSVVLAGRHYSADHLQRSAARFLELARNAAACRAAPPPGSAHDCAQAFDHAVRSEFAVYAIRGRAHLTAYYTPTVDVSVKRDRQFRFPIYGLPPSPELRRASRRDIDFRGALAGHGLELFYARDRYDVYLLHVEGGGKLRIHRGPDDRHPTIAYLSYAGDNGQRFRLIDETMRHHGMLHATDRSRHAQRRYLAQHPNATESVYASCPGYVFFRPTKTPPLGSAGAALTPGRSLASDPAYFAAKGLIAYVLASLPELPQQPVDLESNPCCLAFRQIGRFFIDQDEGPYIKGPARFDLYFGEDDHARFLANNLNAEGEVYFLVLKQGPG